jgi:hypothetical protein
MNSNIQLINRQFMILDQGIYVRLCDYVRENDLVDGGAAMTDDEIEKSYIIAVVAEHDATDRVIEYTYDFPDDII